MGWTPLARVELPDTSMFRSLAAAGAPGGAPRMLEITVGGFLYVLVVIEMVLGLVLTSLAITGFTGLLRAEE